MSAPGDVYLADLGLVAKVRPVLIVSADDPKAVRNLFTFIPLTSEKGGGPYEVLVPKPPWLHQQCVANVQGINSLDKKYLVRKLGAFDSDTLNRVKKALDC